jgi:hypothetical protein
LPRRVRLELEVERETDRTRRTRLTAIADQADGRLVVDDGARMPEPGAFVRIDAEWMLVSSVDGDSAMVVRGQRGTTPRTHAPGALVHWGAPLTRELSVTTCREDWNP